MTRTYGTMYLDGRKWVISELEPHVAIKLKAIFPKVPRSGVAPFLLDCSPEVSNDLEWFFQRYPLFMKEDDVRTLLEQKSFHLKKTAELERLMRPDYTPSMIQLKLPMRNYQAQAVDLYRAGNILLVGDGVGLGKTAIGIGSFTFQELLPAVVVVQTHLPTQWKEQIYKFMDANVHIVKGTKPYNLPPADVYIWKYSCLAGWIDTFRMGLFKSAVFDEVQELRIEGTMKYAAGSELARNVEHVLGLSATPIYNYGDEIFNILNMMKEGCLGSKQDFLREWTGYGAEVKDPKALGTYLRENYLFLRRTRKDVGRELPKVNKIVHTVEYDEETVKGVEDLARILAIKVTTGSFVERGQAARELDIMVRQATGIAKAKSVAQYVKILLENGEPVLLAGWHRDVYDIWLEELKDYKPVMYTGSESPKQKEDAKHAFINGESNLMIISLRSGVGLDGLQARCSMVVFGELDWSPAIHEQVTGRVDRDGQETPVTAIYLVSDSGSDPLMVDLLGLKSSQAREIIDPFSVVQEQYSDEGRIKRLAEQYLAKTQAKQGTLFDSLTKEDPCPGP